jgi:hypothetical protein
MRARAVPIAYTFASRWTAVARACAFASERIAIDAAEFALRAARGV